MVMMSADMSFEETSIRIEVFDPIRHSAYLPELYRRIHHLESVANNPQAETDSRYFLAGAAIKDPNFRLFIALSGETLIGHGIVEVQLDRLNNKILFARQVMVDPPTPGVVDKLMQASDNYAQAMNILTMYMETLPLHTPRSWTRRYGFTLEHYRMKRSIV